MGWNRSQVTLCATTMTAKYGLSHPVQPREQPNTSVNFVPLVFTSLAKTTVRQHQYQHALHVYLVFIRMKTLPHHPTAKVVHKVFTLKLPNKHPVNNVQPENTATHKQMQQHVQIAQKVPTTKMVQMSH